MCVSISIVSKFKLSANHFNTVAVKVIDGDKGKLLFVNELSTGKWVVDVNVTEEHIEFIQDKVDFSAVDYTLYLGDFVSKMSRDNKFYELEQKSNTIVGLFEDKQFVQMLLMNKSLFCYSGTGYGASRVSQAVNEIFENDELAKGITGGNCLFSISYDKSKRVSVKEEVLLSNNIRLLCGIKSQFKLDKVISNDLGGSLGLSVVTTAA